MDLDEETWAFLEAGSALIVGTVDGGGQPVVSRGWGLDVLDGDRVRLLLEATDGETLANAADGGAMAITAADVRTLRSVQLKGKVLLVEPATTADEERSARYRDAFFTDITETDGTDPALVARISPTGIVACVMEVEELYDQTPGPGAGAPMGTT